jgi:Na+-driven multidrug efflux pump
LRALWIPMLVAMTLQSAYAIVNLVFVSQLGDRAVSGLAITIQAFFIVLALGQVLGQTGLAEISQAYGRGVLTRGRWALTT